MAEVVNFVNIFSLHPLNRKTYNSRLPEETETAVNQMYMVYGWTSRLLIMHHQDSKNFRNDHMKAANCDSPPMSGHQNQQPQSSNSNASNRTDKGQGGGSEMRNWKLLIDPMLKQGLVQKLYRWDGVCQQVWTIKKGILDWRVLSPEFLKFKNIFEKLKKNLILIKDI